MSTLVFPVLPFALCCGTGCPAVESAGRVGTSPRTPRGFEVTDTNELWGENPRRGLKGRRAVGSAGAGASGRRKRGPGTPAGCAPTSRGAGHPQGPPREWRLRPARPSGALAAASGSAAPGASGRPRPEPCARAGPPPTAPGRLGPRQARPWARGCGLRGRRGLTFPRPRLGCALGARPAPAGLTALESRG